MTCRCVRVGDAVNRRIMRRISLCLVLLLLVIPVRASQPAASQPSTQPAEETNLLAMGDWGEDTVAQRQVAAAMARYVESSHEHFTAALLLGDNFYFKLTGVDDPRWQTLFEQMYDPKILDMPFYACLGNHDYDGNNLQIELAYAKEHPHSRFKMPEPWYRLNMPRGKPQLMALMLDSNKDNLTELQWNRQINWIKSQLEGPRAQWVICCAHHPMYSNGFFLMNGLLQQDWGTLFDKYGVDFYIAGHEHNLQHLEIPGAHPSLIIAGGGGAHPHPLFRADRGFSREDFGFVHLRFTPQKAVVRFVGTDGSILHAFERDLAGHVKILQTTANSTPQKNALKAYLELRNRKATTQPAAR